MGIKPTINLTAYELPGLEIAQLMPRPTNLPVPKSDQTTSFLAPVPVDKPRTIWGTLRTAKYHRAQAELIKAQSGYLRAQTEMAKSLVAAARVAGELSELSETYNTDAEIRQLNRERDLIAARNELEQARCGFYVTQEEVDKLRKPRVKKVQPWERIPPCSIRLLPSCKAPSDGRRPSFLHGGLRTGCALFRGTLCGSRRVCCRRKSAVRAQLIIQVDRVLDAPCRAPVGVARRGIGIAGQIETPGLLGHTRH